MMYIYQEWNAFKLSPQNITLCHRGKKKKKKKKLETCSLNVPLFTRANAHFMPFQNINVLPLALAFL